MSEYIIELDSKHSIALGLALAEEMRGGDAIRGEIVRCRDCANLNIVGKCPCGFWALENLNGFCSWGERK